MKPCDHPLVDEMVMIPNVRKKDSNIQVRIVVGSITSRHVDLPDDPKFKMQIHYNHQVLRELQFQVSPTHLVTQQHTVFNPPQAGSRTAGGYEFGGNAKVILCARGETCCPQEWARDMSELRAFLTERLVKLHVSQPELEKVINRITERTSRTVRDFVD